jgi:hypothetical protein
MILAMRNVRHSFGLFFASLAIVTQLALGAAVPATAMSLAAVSVICQHDGNPNAPAAPARQSPDCLLCFFCHGTTSPIGPVAASPLLPAPRATRIAGAVVLPPATAPPLRIVLDARPRGPPISG